MKAPGQFKGV